MSTATPTVAQMPFIVLHGGMEKRSAGPGRVPPFEGDRLPTEVAAALIYTLVRFGRLDTAHAAQQTGYNYTSVHRVLSKASRKLPFYQPSPGRWAVNDDVTEAAARIGPALERLRHAARQDGRISVEGDDLRLLLDALGRTLRDVS